jgi:hypothetical protein
MLGECIPVTGSSALLASCIGDVLLLALHAAHAGIAMLGAACCLCMRIWHLLRPAVHAQLAAVSAAWVS